MSLRMSICAVISLGLTAGAHWVAGQASRDPDASDAPPRVAGVEPASRGDDLPAPSNSPPRLAIPNTGAQDPPQGQGETPSDAPPRIASPSGSPRGSAADRPEPPSPGSGTPPAVAEVPPPSSSGPAGTPDVPPAVADRPSVVSGGSGLQADAPPDVADEPSMPSISSPVDAPPELAGDPSMGVGSDPFANTDAPPLPDLGGLDQPGDPIAPDVAAFPPDLPDDPGTATPVSAVLPDPSAAPQDQDQAQPPTLSGLLPGPPDDNSLEDLPAEPNPSGQGVVANGGIGGPADSSSFVGAVEAPPVAEMAPPGGGMAFPLDSGAIPSAGDDPLADAQMPVDPGSGDPFNPSDVAGPSFGDPGTLEPPPDIPGEASRFPGLGDSADPSSPPGSPAPEPVAEMPRPAAESPNFASANPEPPADPSIRASAAPRQEPGTGAMADTLADRLPEGPRDVQLNLDVAMPPTANINLPMNAVVTLRNEGRDDAFDVVVRLPLPEGLEHQESSPPAESMEDDNRTLVWRWASLPAGDSRTIDLTVKPLKAVPMDLVPRVSSVMAAKSRTAVQEPKLKIDLVGPNGEVLKGSNFDFQVTVRNVGNGPARAVNLIATLSGGLQGYDMDGSLNDARRFELDIGDLGVGEVSGPFPLSVRADSQGVQTCSIKAESPDVLPETPVATKEVTVVAPKLRLDVVGPDSRPVGSVADYVVTIANDGTTAATDVAVALFAPESGSPDVPKDARYRQDPEKRLHSIYWRLPRLDQGESRTFRVPIRLDRIAIYTVEVAAHCEGFREPRDTVRDQQPTDVMGIADVRIVGLERRDPVIDAGGTTQFEIRIRNDGSKEATNVKVDFVTNEWLAVEKTDPAEYATNPDNPVQHGFAAIDRLAPGVERTFIVTVKATKAAPSGQAVANFDVRVYWDDLPPSAAISFNTHVRIAEGQVARSPGGGGAPR